MINVPYFQSGSDHWKDIGDTVFIHYLSELVDTHDSKETICCRESIVVFVSIAAKW